MAADLADGAATARVRTPHSPVRREHGPVTSRGSVQYHSTVHTVALSILITTDKSPLRAMIIATAMTKLWAARFEWHQLLCVAAANIIAKIILQSQQQCQAILSSHKEQQH